MNIKKVLITGGAGFIGSALAEQLLDQGKEVIVVDNLTTGYKKNVPENATLIKRNIANDETYNKLREYNGIDAVLHTAGQSSGEASFDDPKTDFNSHAVGTFKLLRWCQKVGIKRVIYASSMSIYGDPEYFPVDESHRTDPKTYYAAGKRAAESYVRLFNNIGMENTILRLFSVYGPGQNMSNMKQGMVSIFLSFLINEDKILIKGPLERFRDFVYISDVVDVWIDVLTNSKTYGETYNVCRGEKVTVKQLIDSMVEISDIDKPKIEVTDGTPGDQFGIYGDVKKLESDIGWSPSIPLRKGLKIMIEEATN